MKIHTIESRVAEETDVVSYSYLRKLNIRVQDIQISTVVGIWNIKLFDFLSFDI
jgi:hypothetical protein